MSEKPAAVGRLLPGLAVVEVGDGIAVTGGLRRQYFRGKAAKQVLPKLLRLLDGTHEREDICRELGLTDGQLRKALSVLDERDLLEYSTTPWPQTTPSEEAVAYYARIKAGAGYRETSDLTNRLNRSRVTVIGDEDATEPMIHDLIASGVGSVEHGRSVVLDETALAFAGTDLTIAVWTGRRSDAMTTSAVAEASRKGTPVLRVHLGVTHVELGPYLVPGYSVCLQCLDKGRSEATWDIQPSRPVKPGLREAMMGLAGAEAVSVLVGGAGLKLARHITTLSLNELQMSRYLVTPYPECDACGMTGTGHAPSTDTVAVQQYDWAVQGTLPMLQPRLTNSQLDRLEKLENERTPFYSHPRWPLPEGSPPVVGSLNQEAMLPSSAAVEEKEFAELLRRVGGLRQGVGEPAGQRWTPNGGNLASVELYMARNKGAGQLPQFALRYDDIDHALIAVHPKTVTVADVCSATDLPTGEPYFAVVVLVAALGRLSRKYEAFSYRLVHLDAGVAMTQLDAVAAGYGWQTTWAATWDERAAALMGLDPREQLVTGVVGIGIPHKKQRDGGSTCR